MDFLALNSSAMGSSASLRGRSTPPTSDPIEAEMISSDEDERQHVQKPVSISCLRSKKNNVLNLLNVKTNRKRKIILEDSDEDIPVEVSTKQRKPARQNLSPVEFRSAFHITALKTC